ncbi:lipase member K-like isoform X1 [Notechis scutatus]|uniref:Lipase member K-like isoform X1 n=1 Tax=Notechis scutatus TaxID=8663 RepID=A0A6J1VHZ0_9SAUR|nr:lipase member K-like isoform X1 [Notechis scutatus]
MWLVLILLYWPVLVEGKNVNRNVNPEARLNSKQLILYWKYPLEEHYVVTEDGYILNLFRIPHGRENNTTTGPKRVVFLQHGLLVDAAQWYQNFPHNSLAFMLADAGYDVWLGNSRGNTWSKNHTSLSPFLEKLWKFSYDQMAKYDLPASIDFILQKTGQQQLYYIGHSQGTTIAFIAFSTNKQLASKIKLYLALAPVATVKNAKTPLAQLAKLSDIEIKILFGRKEFSPKTYFGTLFSTNVCSQEALASICSNLLFVLNGYNEENLNMSRVDVYTSYVPAGTSVQNMIHWKQAINSGKLQAYDHGRLGNKFHYGQVKYFPADAYLNSNDMYCTYILYWTPLLQQPSSPHVILCCPPCLKAEPIYYYVTRIALKGFHPQLIHWANPDFWHTTSLIQEFSH